MHEIQRWLSHPWGQIFVVICARWLIFVLPLLILVAWRWGNLSRHALVEIMWSTLLASILVFGAEIIIGRTRPFLVDPSLAVLVPRPHTMSFPSAHASIAYALAFMTLHWSMRVGIGAVLLADLVAFGRIAAGVHYPTDVLAGILVALVAFAVVRFGHGWTRAVR